MATTDNLHWILSFYRTSEISGALFFGQLANALRPSRIQADMTRHFADEAQHAALRYASFETEHGVLSVAINPGKPHGYC